MPQNHDGTGAFEVSVELGALTSIAHDPQVAVRVGPAVASLVNGVGGDPLLQLRLLHQSRSLLFDMGDSGRMALRSAHQVSDVFISHGHADHIGGFMWFMRSRIGHFPPCRLFGPPGLLGHITGMLQGVLWDRVEDRGPRFVVHEWHGDHLKRWKLDAGQGPPAPLEDLATPDNVIYSEPEFRVRAAMLDHGTPVMAFSWEPFGKLNVRKNGVEGIDARPGPWLHDLKMAVLRSSPDKLISPGNGYTYRAGDLAEKLLIQNTGEPVVYATDFADTPENIKRMTDLARDAHTLFCESSFMLEDADQARRTGHLTTEATARIANAAGVRQLIAFHFSHRYARRRNQVYSELLRFTDRLLVPERETAPSGCRSTRSDR
ncbi:MBL fold metallo-hydrolase [Marinobacter sp. M216]|uniref:MBL fold metallo-hydrolase n=1 Tax=Marinobacter albus TaxID=3030833 RepID=A0ABT7H9L4_9GAMM|nr:MBL fold metallo-hydrolase [Marinobacter sp. M216]MDK9557043.1 MBL fold metallo-hydrolase [Marinobacter sp. M216]